MLKIRLPIFLVLVLSMLGARASLIAAGAPSWDESFTGPFVGFVMCLSVFAVALAWLIASRSIRIEGSRFVLVRGGIMAEMVDEFTDSGRMGVCAAFWLSSILAIVASFAVAVLCAFVVLFFQHLGHFLAAGAIAAACWGVVKIVLLLPGRAPRWVGILSGSALAGALLSFAVAFLVVEFGWLGALLFPFAVAALIGLVFLFAVGIEKVAESGSPSVEAIRSLASSAFHRVCPRIEVEA